MHRRAATLSSSCFGRAATALHACTAGNDAVMHSFSSSTALQTPIRGAPTVFQSVTSTTNQVDYQIEKAFDEPFMKLFFEGHDVDYKASVRDALLAIVPKRETNFCARIGPPTEPGVAHRNVLRLLRALGSKQLLSFAEIRSTPRHFLSFYEVLATCDAALALSAAEHFTFASMVATHAQPEIQAQVLNGVDTVEVVGTIAWAELAAGDEAPLNTEARWDTVEQCFFLRGAAKISVVNATSAHWALVAATLTAGKDMHRGTQLFFVRLRTDDGQLVPGVTVRDLREQSNPVLDACGVGVVHFNHLRLTRANIMSNFEISTLGEIALKPGHADVLPIHVLKYRRRLATAALYVGTLKAQHTMIHSFTAQKRVVGHDGYRNHPLYGVQHVQTAAVCSLMKPLVYFIGWMTLLPSLTDPHKAPSPEDETKLAGVVHNLQEAMLETNAYSDRVLGIHSALHSATTWSASTTLALRSEGYDTSSLIREVAYRCVTLNQGTQHWGWRIANVFQRIPILDRFLKNPMYTPRQADLGRHLLFFSHKHFTVKRRLQMFREIERRKGGAEHMWYDWTTFRHRQVQHCGDAYMEAFFLDATMKTLEKAYDPRGRKLIRDMGWIYACSRLSDNLTFHLQQKMLSLPKAQVVQSHLDNIVTVMAPQTMNLVSTLMVPECWRPPCGREAYWTIPGTTTGVERGEAVTVVKEKTKADSDRKEDQEELREEAEEHDLLHGLDKKP